ncbi:hypothetical protein BCON_0274g00190 [Botryotinia convoluta]|uniref:Uncharacterized protein n=1 Tax=Botryotinia convoluta TaxID=54673 RepID=A0A4Z1HLA0_9HELO|nr:hypothetical protein BCON_0274g00190 [Botryotinia convoluta]
MHKELASKLVGAEAQAAASTDYVLIEEMVDEVVAVPEHAVTSYCGTSLHQSNTLYPGSVPTQGGRLESNVAIL